MMDAVHREGGERSAVEDARENLARAIAELRAANVTVPVALHRAAHALAYAAGGAVAAPLK